MILTYSYTIQTLMNFLPWQMIVLNNYQNSLLLINYIYILIRLVIVYLVPNIKIWTNLNCIFVEKKLNK